MCFANLLERGLNLADGVGLEVLDFLEGTADDSERLGLDSCRRQQLVDLGVLRLERLLDGLVLLLEDKVADASLLVNLVNKPVELIEQRFLLTLEVLELLEADLELPLDVLYTIFVFDNLLLRRLQFVHDLVVDVLLLG